MPLDAAAATRPLLEVEDLARDFDVSKPLLFRLLQGEGKRILHAVAGVSFSIPRGTTLSLVGESGCGKTTVARLVVGLYAPTRGSIRIDGTDMATLRSRAAQAPVRRRMQMIFQDPYASLNPRWRVGDIIAEPIRAFGLMRDRSEIEARVGELLRQVGLSPKDAEKFPHEFSGGQRQRISIARALSSNPEFLVCDEPTSALDVSVQAVILRLLAELRSRLRMSYLFVSHDLNVVRLLCERVVVMYLGKAIETAPSETLFRAPLHPYTRALLAAIPDPARRGTRGPRLDGSPRSPIDPDPAVCRFHGRCPIGTERCTRAMPVLRPLGPAHAAACHLAGPENGTAPRDDEETARVA